MSSTKLDTIDAAIIDLLQQDARMSATDIARHLPDGTPRMVRYRIQRLLDAGIIFLTAVVQPRSLGYTVMADVLVETEPGRVREIVEHLAALDHVTYASASTGDADISIQVVTRSVDELYEFVLGVVQKIPGVRQTRTYLLPLALKFGYHWKVPHEVYRESPHGETDAAPDSVPQDRGSKQNAALAGSR